MDIQGRQCDQVLNLAAFLILLWAMFTYIDIDLIFICSFQKGHRVILNFWLV